MRTIKHILITGCIALAVSSCDYLDQQPYEYWQPEETFIDYNKTIQMLNSVYVSMPNGYQSNYTAFLDASTDDGAYVDPANAMYKLGQGYATEISPIENRWADLYIGIRRTLYFEQYIPLLQNNAGWTDAQVESYKELAIAESKSVRALYYFELIKRYGGVPLVKKTYTLDDKEIITLPRNNFSDCVDYIVNLCNEASEIFTRYNYITNQYRGFGFLSASTCPLAIKAKTLAYAASPLFNNVQNPILGYTDGNVQERWKLAAKALKTVIDLAPSKLYLYPNFEKLFIIQPNQNTEYIVYTGNPKTICWNFTITLLHCWVREVLVLPIIWYALSRRRMVVPTICNQIPDSRIWILVLMLRSFVTEVFWEQEEQSTSATPTVRMLSAKSIFVLPLQVIIYANSLIRI